MGASWGLDGFWITATGILIDKRDTDENHADIVLANISSVSQADADAYLNRTSNDSSYDMTIVDYGLREGWIRVLEDGESEVSAEYHNGVASRSAWLCLQRFISRDSMADKYIFEDPRDRSNAAVFMRKADAIRFIGTNLR